MHRTAARLILLVLFAVLASFGNAETLLAEAKIASIDARGFILKIGTEEVPVEDESSTRFWKSKDVAKKEQFVVGDEVGVRIKIDSTPAVVREMADLDTWKWLNRVRKEVVSGTVVKAESKFVTLRLEDSSTFTFRISDKTDLKVKGQDVSVTDLAEGQKLYAKGRLLPSLDTWLVSLSDTEPAAKTTTKSKSTKEKSLRISAAGKLRGVVDHHLPAHGMFDIWYEGRLLHITYTAKTTFTWGKEKTGPGDLRKGVGVDITYKRDSFGRLIASKVELFEVAR